MARKLCTVCGIRNAATTNGHDFNDICDPCFQEGGWENTHNDAGHPMSLSVNDMEAMKAAGTWDEYLEETSDCWICHPELNLAKKPAKAKVAKVQGFRRTQLNHKNMCTHAQTPKARRTCKEAFWAGVKVMMTEGKLTEDQAWEHCIKALTSPKPAKLTVVPLGPKGGVINQLKASKGKFLTKAEGQKLYGK